jgi:putative methionine-R-sulfoxide reductase with GAF domain
MEPFREKIAGILSSSLSRQQKAKSLVVLIQSEGPFHWVGLYDVSATHILAIAWTGNEAPAFPVFPISKGINGAAVAAMRPVIVQDVSKDNRYLTTFGSTRSEAIFPVLSPDLTRVNGTIDIESDRVNAFQEEHIAFLEECSVLLRELWR